MNGRRLLVISAGWIVLASACGGLSGSAEKPTVVTTVTTTLAPSTTTTAPPDPGPKAALTGLPADPELAERPAVVVKISNNDGRSLAALVGLEFADIVIEERIEDRATRFAAIFQSQTPSVLGPVRSARTTDFALLTNLGKPILIFSGAEYSVVMKLRDLAAQDLAVLVVDDVSGTYLYRDRNFRRPDNLFVDVRHVLDNFSEAAGAALPIFAFGEAESDTRLASVAGPGVTVSGRDTVSFVYQEGSGYVRVQNGAVHVSREGVVLEVDNLIVMEVPYRRPVEAVTVGEGPVSILIGGRRWSGTWARADRLDPYVFRTDSGAEILLEPGRTWLTLVPQGTYKFEVAPDISSLVLGAEG